MWESDRISESGAKWEQYDSGWRAGERRDATRAVTTTPLLGIPANRGSTLRRGARGGWAASPHPGFMIPDAAPHSGQEHGRGSQTAMAGILA